MLLRSRVSGRPELWRSGLAGARQESTQIELAALRQRAAELERSLQRQRELTAQERRRADAVALQVRKAFKVAAWPAPRPKSDAV
jgi:hypothetical protein